MGEAMQGGRAQAAPLSTAQKASQPSPDLRWVLPHAGGEAAGAPLGARGYFLSVLPPFPPSHFLGWKRNREAAGEGSGALEGGRLWKGCPPPSLFRSVPLFLSQPRRQEALWLPHARGGGIPWHITSGIKRGAHQRRHTCPAQYVSWSAVICL